MNILSIAKVLTKPLLSAIQASTLYYVKTGNEYKTDAYISDVNATALLDISSERLRSDTVKKYSPIFNPLVLALAYKDTTTFITAGVNVAYLRSPRTFLLKHVRASVFIPSNMGLVTIQVNLNGVNIAGSTLLSIDANETSSLTAVVNFNNSLPSNGIVINDDDIISIDVVSAGTDATGLIVQLHEGQDTSFTYT